MPKRTGVTQFVADHIKLSNDQIVEAAKGHGFNYNRQQVMRARWSITYKTKKRGKVSTKAKRPTERSALQKWKPAKPGAARTTTAHEAKVAQLRRIIFELGYDKTREVFEVFEQAHQQMK